MTKVSAAKLKRMLDFDPLRVAGEMTGRSYKDDDFTALIGFTLSAGNCAERREALIARGDTVLVNDLARYLEIIEQAGFEKVLVEDFNDDLRGTDEPRQYFIYAHRDGLLLAFDTYQIGSRAVTLNSGKVYYNWVPKLDEEGHHDYSLVSSGGMRGDIWVGDHDCREALLFNLDALRRNGRFLPQWERRAFHQLLHYQDWKVVAANHYRGGDEVTAERISRLPDWVRTMIGDA